MHTEKRPKFVLGGDQESPFFLLKTALILCFLLRHFDPDLPEELRIHASGPDLDAFLVQRRSYVKAPIVYPSHTRYIPEANYGSTGEECLAVDWRVTEFSPYLYWKQFKVLTHHCALCWFTRFRSPSYRLARWELGLQKCDYDIVYRPGRGHQGSDALSWFSLRLSENDDA